MKLRFSKIKTDEPRFEVFDGTRNITITKDLYESLQLPDGALPLDPTADLNSIKINGTTAGITISPELIQKNETERSNIVKIVLNDHSDIDNVVFDPNKKYEVVFNFDPRETETDGKFADDVIREELIKGTNIYKINYKRISQPSFFFNETYWGPKELSVRSIQYGLDDFGRGISLSSDIGEAWLDSIICDGTLEYALNVYKDNTQNGDWFGINSDVAIYANDGADIPIALPEMTKDELLNYPYIDGKRYMFILTPELLEELPIDIETDRKTGIVFDDVLDQIRTTKNVEIGRLTIKDGVTRMPYSRICNSSLHLSYMSVYIPTSVTQLDRSSLYCCKITYNGELSNFMEIMRNSDGNYDCTIRDIHGNFDISEGEPM